MRRLAGIVLLFAATLAPTGCRPSSAEVNREIKTVRRLHSIYREFTIAKNPADQPKIDEVAKNLDTTLANLDTLTGD